MDSEVQIVTGVYENLQQSRLNYQVTTDKQNLRQNPSNIKIANNSFQQGNNKGISLLNQESIQENPGQSTTKLNFKLEIEDNIQQSICKKYRRIIIIVIIVLFLIGGGLGLLFGLLNRNSNSNHNIIDNNNTINDPNAYFDLVKLNSTLALCLDGSPASYYISRNGNASKVILYFQYGAWCGNRDYESTIESCYQRSKTYLGSSNSLEISSNFSEGILSMDEKNYFKDWKKVYLSYCDGMGHQGTREQPIQYNGTLLYFRGHNNTVEKLQSLEQQIGLFSNATQIVVSGESAGGLASLMWVNYVADRAQKAKVLCMPVSGVFYDSFNYQYNAFYYRELFKSIVNISNSEIDPPIPECVQAYPNNKQNCYFAQYIYNQIKVPILIVQSLYDTWCIPHVLGQQCASLGNQNLSTCNITQMQRIESYRTSLFNLLQEIGTKRNNAVWGVACPTHFLVTDYKLNSENYRIPKLSSNSINQAIKRWIENTTLTHMYLDSTHWPENYRCSGNQ